MGFMDELKRNLRNFMKDVEKEVEKTWTVDYQGHRIEVVNRAKEEALIIDGKTVDKNQRQSMFIMTPFSKLSGTIERSDGSTERVTVKIGGYLKLNCIVKIGRKTVLRESLEIEPLPWEHKEKIVPFVEKQIQTHQKIVDDTLPDEDLFYGENELRFVSGLFDRLMMDEVPTPFYVKKLLKLFQRQIENPTTTNRKKTYEHIIFDNIASYGQKFIESFQQATWDETGVQREALWLLEHAAHREVVKFAITVLGCTNCEAYKSLLMTIGMHEEFTQYVVFALKQGTTNANENIWKLAQSVFGWGKIAAVEALEADTPEIKQWLLLHGYKNEILIDHLALTCAIKGELHQALLKDMISKPLYDGASRIIQALISDNATRVVHDYPHVGIALSRFIFHAKTHCQTLEDFYLIIEINEFLNENKDEVFSGQDFQFIQQDIQQMIRDPKWLTLALETLQEHYDEKALEIANVYHLDMTDYVFRLLEKNPTKLELYEAIMNMQKQDSIEKLCTWFEKQFTLSHLSEKEQACLQVIICHLHDYAGSGLPLLEAALKSDDESLRFNALEVLNEWPQSAWIQSNLVSILRRIELAASDKEERKLIKQLFKQ